MTFSEKYSCYYDLLYDSKDYKREIDFIQNLIHLHLPQASSILELGCGTGKHATLLAQRGYQVCGVDCSAQMLKMAAQRLSGLPGEIATKVLLHEGDLRNIDLNQKFDVVLSLFHVISYQTTHADLSAAFSTAKASLNPGGIFIFDCWYGPGVLTDQPIIRVKRLEDDRVSIVRIAEPTLRPNDNVADINYQIFVKDKNSGITEDFREVHSMRYLFQPEVKLLLKQHHLELIECSEWMTTAAPSLRSWNVYFLARA